MTGYGGLKEYIYIIAAIFYVGGMFPIFYAYQVFPADRYTLVPDVAYISTIACIFLFGQFLVAALTTPKEIEKKAVSSS